MKCVYCSKLCKNGNSLRNHERLCKLNPNRQNLISGFIEYNKKKKELGIKGTNQFLKAKRLGMESPIVTQETRNKLSNKSKGRVQSEEEREMRKRVMQEVVQKHPDSYTKNNVVGRVRNIKYGENILKGSWEVLVATWLDSHNIKWEHEVKSFEYEWNGKRKYYPDFYLPELDLFIEVKGYETERDRCKWKVVTNLVVIKKAEIEKIKQGIFTL